MSRNGTRSIRVRGTRNSWCSGLPIGVWKRSCPLSPKCIVGAIGRSQCNCRSSVVTSSLSSRRTWSERLRVVRVDGVLGLVGSHGEGTPIPDEEITAVRTLVEGAVPWSSHPFLKIGQRVRVRSGALDGVEGILVSRNGSDTLVISIDAIQRSLAVRVEGYEIEAANSQDSSCIEAGSGRTHD